MFKYFCFLLEQTVIAEVQQLALISEQMNNYLSLSICIFVFMRIMNGISVFCMIILNEKNDDTVDFAVPAVLSWLYFFYIVRLNRFSRNTFTRICTILDDRVLNQKKSASTKLRLSFSGHTKESAQIRLHGLHLYTVHFQMRLFSLAQIDSPFIMASVLFVLNYVVFLYQVSDHFLL